MSGTELVRIDLCRGHQLAEMWSPLPGEPDVRGWPLCGSPKGGGPAVSNRRRVVLLADHDRAKWDRAAIDRGLRLLEEVHQEPMKVPMIPARIAAVTRPHPSQDTDWGTIVELYRWLYELRPSPVVP